MRLSVSSMSLFATCPRKFQLLKLVDTAEAIETSREETIHTAYGHAYGSGAEHMLQHAEPHSEQAFAEAIGVAFQAFRFDLENSFTPNKTWELLVLSLQQLQGVFPFSKYSAIEGATEVGFRIWLSEEDYFVGFLDLGMLKHTATGEVVPTVVELKSTQLKNKDVAPNFANTPQGISYSLVLAHLWPEYAAHSYDVLYVVNQLTTNWHPQTHVFEVEYTTASRLSFLLQLKLHYEYIQQMRELEFFPKTGNCMSYGGVCQFYGLCDSLPDQCSPLSLEQQNYMDVQREASVKVDLDFNELISKEMSLATGES